MEAAYEWQEDSLLGGRLRFAQPVRGYRVAIDPVLLAAAVPATAGERAFEIGMGSAAAALCLALRVPDLVIDGIELQADLCALARWNARLNRLDDRVRVTEGDLLTPPAAFLEGAYDHVFANPPHLEAEKTDPPKERTRAIAHVEGYGGGSARLAEWVGFALRLAKPGGTLTFLHRMDRLEELLENLRGGVGALAAFPLLSAAGRPAKRVLVQGRKGGPPSLARQAGLVLHDGTGAYTAEAEAVLRDGKALHLVGA